MLKRLPPFPDIVSVYAVIATMLFAWSILQFFWYLPSWLFFMRISDLIGVFCYVIASSFVESLAFLSFLILLCLTLPPIFLKDEFVVRGTSIALSVIGAFMFYFRFNVSKAYGVPIVWFGAAVILAAAVISFLTTKIRPMRRALTWLSDRLIVFLYVLIPLSLLSLLVIIVRNVV